MNIVKIEDGLLEQDDYFLTTRTTEFLGDSMFSRSNNELEIYNGYLERNFTYENFVIMVDKEPDDLLADGKFAFYTRKLSRRNGIEETYDVNMSGSATNWKIIQYDGFIQTYISYDNKQTWIACGGGQIREYTDVQGFYVQGLKPLRITKYETYRNPYVRLFDITDKYIVELVDVNNNVIDTQNSDLGDVKFFLHDNVRAKFKIYDENGSYIYETGYIDLKLGDSFLNLPYEIDLYYGSLIERYSTTKLNSLKEVIQIKNSSTSETYQDIVVSPVHANIDTIQLSLDGINYVDSVTIPNLAPQEMKDIYIWITKNRTLPAFGKRSFVLEIE